MHKVYVWSLKIPSSIHRTIPVLCFHEEENRVHTAFLSPEDVSREVCRNLFMTPWYLNSVNAEVDQLLPWRLFSSEHCDASPLLTEASQCRQTCYIDWLTDLLYWLVDTLRGIPTSNQKTQNDVFRGGEVREGERLRRLNEFNQHLDWNQIWRESGSQF